MVFNKEGRDMLRLAVTEKIKELKSAIDHKDEFKRLTIKKDWIEPLLFDEHIDSEGYHYKTIGYTYDDIRYIDLSNVSFEDVSFDFRNYDCNKNLTKEEKDKMILNLSGTNAKIDFMKTYEMRKYNQLNLSNVCFSGLDLSNNNYVDENGVSVFHNALVINCDLRGTGLKITTPEVHFYDSNLYCVDLSELEMHLYDVINSFSNCDLRDTGLNIKIYDSVNPDSIAKAMQNPNYEGCRLGKTIITSNREKGERAAGIYYDYEAWRNAMIDEVVDDLDEQVNGPKKVLVGCFLHEIDTEVNEALEEEGKLKSNKTKQLSKEDKSLQLTGTGLTEHRKNRGKKMILKKAERKTTKKSNTTNVGSFYGCDNIIVEPKKTKKKTLKKENNKSNNQGANAWINEDIDE